MIFTNPLLLIGLVAIAIPIVVHLFNFRRYKKVYFSNVEHLQQLLSETKRQSRLREYLILAARILAIAFLVLAFAQPIIPHKEQPLRTGGSAVSVYIDNSFSLENTNAEGTLLETAKKKAREIASAYKPSDQFQLLDNNIDGAHFRWVSRDEFLSMVDELEASPSSPLLSSMAAKQQDFLHSSRADNMMAYIISDFQVSTADFNQFPTDSSVSTTFVHLEAAAVDNISIDSVTFDAPIFMMGSHVTAQVHISNHGGNAVENLPIKLFVNNTERALASASLPEHSTQTVDIPFTIDATGVLNCRIESADYPITFDDQFFFSINVSQQLSMIEIYSGADASPYLGKLFGNDSLISYRSASERSMNFSDLTNYNFIVLNELSSITSGMMQTLLTFVTTGGSLLIVPPADADLESYNQLLQMLHAPQLTAFNKQSAKASTINSRAMLYRNVFSAAADENMEMPTLSGYFKTSATAGTVMETAISLTGGEPYLTLTPCANGHVYLFTAPLRPPYTDFVQQALFVPTLYNMALFSQPHGELYTTIDNTTPVMLSRHIAPSEGTYRLQNSDATFELIPDLRQQAGRTYFVPHNQIKTADNYTFTATGDTHAEGLSFNYSRLESDMRFYSRNDVAQQVKNYHLHGCDVVKNATKPLDDYIRSRSEGTPLWRWCVLLALLMLLAETLLLRLPQRRKLSK